MKPSALAKPFSAFGVVIGLAVAATLMPDGCTIKQEASERLRIGVPLWSPLVFAGLGYLLVRLRKPLAAAAVALGAVTVWAAGIGALDSGFEGLGLTPIAAFMFMPMGIAALLISPFSLHFGRRAAKSRRALASADGAVVWSFVCAGANLAAGALYLSTHRAHLDFRLAWASVDGMALLVIIAVYIAVRVRRSTAAFEALPLPPATARSVRLDAALPDVASVIDWGAGDARKDAYDLEDGAPFRSGGIKVWVGDRAESLRRFKQDRALAIIAVVFALAGAVSSIVVILRPPPVKAVPSTQPISFSIWKGC